FSARCLWLFHYLGHENAYILDGGLAKWLQEGNEITTDTPQRKAKTFKPSPSENEIVNMQDVKQKMDDKSAVLIDSRSKDRYLGKTEPLYGRAGHIPGAKNYFWKDVLDAEGNWKDNEELERHFSDLSKSDEIIVSCGSGVSACPNILALKRAGFTNVKLYPGGSVIGFLTTKTRLKQRKSDMVKRCDWVTDEPIYIDYHDHEWGRPVHDDRKLFEMLTLEGAQAGLSWITILKRRENYRNAFDNFEPQKISQYGSDKIEKLTNVEGIIRNKLKINSVVTNAQAFLKVQHEFGSFTNYIWQFVDGKPHLNERKNKEDVPSSTKESEAMSKDLKKRGFKFVGPTICYAFMQATGMVNDHTKDCFLYQSR